MANELAFKWIPNCVTLCPLFSTLLLLICNLICLSINTSCKHPPLTSEILAGFDRVHSHPTIQLILAAGSFHGIVCILEKSDQDSDFECISQLEVHGIIKSRAFVGMALGRYHSLFMVTTKLCGCGNVIYLGQSVEVKTANSSVHILSTDTKETSIPSSLLRRMDSGAKSDEILLSAGYDDAHKCWAEDSGDWYCAVTLKTHSSTVWCISFISGRSRLFLVVDDETLGTFKCYTLKEIKTHCPDKKESNGLWKCVGKVQNTHSSTIYSVDYRSAKSNHGHIASAGGDNRIQIYCRAMGSTSYSPMFSIDTAVTLPCDIHSVRWIP